MAEKNVSGSITKLTIAGTTFDVFADANLSEVPSLFENSSVPTSGKNMRKMTKRSASVEGVVVGCNDAEKAELKSIAEKRDDVTIAYTTASGSVFRTKGWIEFEKRETEENKATLKLFPREDWTPFL